MAEDSLRRAKAKVAEKEEGVEMLDRSKRRMERELARTVEKVKEVEVDDVVEVEVEAKEVKQGMVKEEVEAKVVVKTPAGGGGVSQWLKTMMGSRWVVSQGRGRGGRRGRRGRRVSGRKRGGPSGCRGSCSSAPGTRRRPTSGRPWGRGTTGMTGMTRGTRVGTRGRGVTRGVRWGVTRGVRRKGTPGVAPRIHRVRSRLVYTSLEGTR